MNKRLNKIATSTSQLPMQFPVSSGQQHRKNESQVLYDNFIGSSTPYQTVLPGPADMPYTTVSSSLSVTPYQYNTHNSQNVPVATIKPMQQQPQQQSIFPAPETIDVTALMYQRWSAMRKLYQNPNSLEAMNDMYKAQTKMQSWLESKQIPGQFTGSTGAKVLTQDELSSGYQAWAHQDQLLMAQPVTGGMGMALLQKMGWRPGEGLGKNRKGAVEPLKFRVKLDKRGLASNEDIIATMTKAAKVSSKTSVPTVKTLSGKHPVSLLGEYCSKRKVGAPRYEEFSQSGPDNKKKYLFKVVVNGIAYKPAVANSNKKLAKIEAAQLCLQSIGVIP